MLDEYIAAHIRSPALARQTHGKLRILPIADELFIERANLAEQLAAKQKAEPGPDLIVAHFRWIRLHRYALLRRRATIRDRKHNAAVGMLKAFHHPRQPAGVRVRDKGVRVEKTNVITGGLAN